MNDDMVYLVAVIFIGITYLTVLAVTYWVVMKQDSTVLATVSASIGALIGYVYKHMKERQTKVTKV